MWLRNDKVVQKKKENVFRNKSSGTSWLGDSLVRISKTHIYKKKNQKEEEERDIIFIISLQFSFFSYCIILYD